MGRARGSLGRALKRHLQQVLTTNTLSQAVQCPPLPVYIPLHRGEFETFKNTYRTQRSQWHIDSGDCLHTHVPLYVHYAGAAVCAL